MNRKPFAAALLAALLLLTLAACGKPQPSDAASPSAPAPEEQTEPADANVSADSEAWKTDFEKSLLENYGVTPDHYEELENGIYQVYVEIDGRIVPYVTVDSATGDYHG